MDSDILARAKRSGTPFIEDDEAIFLWSGENPPRLIADFNGWEEGEESEMTLIADNLWESRVRLPEDAYIEYAFLQNDERINDPLNRRKTSNGFGKYNNYFYMPGLKPSTYARRPKDGLQGNIFSTEIETKHLLAGVRRKVTFYQPPVVEPVPLIVAFDGIDYRERIRLPEIVENLSRAGLIRPVALALIPNGGWARAMEYMCSEATLAWVVDKLVPTAMEQLNLINPDEEPGAFATAGASFGGLISMYVSLRAPWIFGKALCQSGGYTVWGQPFPVWDYVRNYQEEKPKLFLDVGRYEWLLDTNREMCDLLEQKDWPFKYQEFNSGHNYPAWRDHIEHGLTYLFGQED